ncbi:hypothetical protein N8E89_22625 (plasmid) [Phyllobacterium sp. A18/5-2]|uniref:hypothetical protein n=1 Tax=Phyllobacterium sp. A18/5-2 TaxID=2978392 RepID=UPI0021C89018|nr:hypothetical protein [Phyllobacterium sp. A18/5-2]UXN67336.1 hypothetical protein N8E89_22625 [Phyllobacterium sp. A18/5-2]
MKNTSDSTFSSVVEDYVAHNYVHSRPITRLIQRELLDPRRNPWVCKPIAAVCATDVEQLVLEICDRPAPHQAMDVLGHLKRIFDFALRPRYRSQAGISFNPTAHLHPSSFCVRPTRRNIVLNEDQIRALWIAAGLLGLPLWAAFQIAMRWWAAGFGMGRSPIGPA